MELVVKGCALWKPEKGNVALSNPPPTRLRHGSDILLRKTKIADRLLEIIVSIVYSIICVNVILAGILYL